MFEDKGSKIEQLLESKEVLPELKLEEIAKSKEPIKGLKVMKEKIEIIQPWENYTIVLVKGISNIQIFDEVAREVEGFKEISNLNKKWINIDWQISEIREKIGKSRVCLDYYSGYYSGEAQKISELPPELRGPVREILEKTKKTTLNIWELSKYTHGDYKALGNIVIFDKYIILPTENESYFAFVTKDERGILLDPQNWKRIEPSDEIPEDLNKCAETIPMLKEGEDHKSLNETYSVLITNIGLNIVKTGDIKNLLISDNIPSIEKNIAVDPSNSNVIYYCSSNEPKYLKRLDLSKDPSSWKPIAVEFPKKYENIHNLQLDPNGNFFLFHTREELIIITKETLEEVKKMPQLTHVNFDNQGRIRAIDKDGHLVIYEAHFKELAERLEKERIDQLMKGLEIKDIFDLKVIEEKRAKKEIEDFAYLLPICEQYEEQLNKALEAITTLEGLYQIRQRFKELSDDLQQQGLKSKEIAFIIKKLEEPIEIKEKEVATRDGQEALKAAKLKLSSGLSMASISEIRSILETIKPTEELLSEDLRKEIKEFSQEFEQKSLELFRQRGKEVIKGIQALISGTKPSLEKITTKAQMDDWLEFSYPQLKSKLASLIFGVPPEAEEVYKAIVKARGELESLAKAFEEKFKREYAAVRERAAEKIEITVNMLRQDIDGFIDRLSLRGFTDRKSVEQYLATSEAYRLLKEGIIVLKRENPDLAKELERSLKVRLSNLLTEIERGTLTQIAETGQQMVLFGKTLFPKWEAKVKEKIERRVELIFEEDTKTHGPGVKPEEILGEVILSIYAPDGSKKKVRLYEDWHDENEWRLGLLSYRGKAIPPSYVKAGDFKKIKEKYSDWGRDKQSRLRKELKEKKNSLKELYLKREKVGKRTLEIDEAWKEEYRRKLGEYATFCAENYIVLLRRLDQIKTKPEIEYSNGKGFVPKWQSHWVMDPQTEHELEEMAKALKMQLELQEGILNLKGHAGSGKDVRVKMFCSLANRPYFAIDCSKWTTEFELSEDIILESREGAPQTIKIPSIVLSGITTPGAVVYFNEFSAMPEQAQIFLHALMDEKRSLTLKTSGGKVVRALPSVLFVSSMNPGYPGTFEPQFATRSRMLSLEIKYPLLTCDPKPGDPNPNPCYDSSEALRIAREVDSLADFTYEASLEHNEFIKMWDKYINGIKTEVPEPTKIQKFDMDVILALIQFANILREDFIKIFEKRREARHALPATQPITGRELRRCGYTLNQMTPEEKAMKDPETVARELLDKYYLTHIDKKEDQEKIRMAMEMWTSKKRMES